MSQQDRFSNLEPNMLRTKRALSLVPPGVNWADDRRFDFQRFNAPQQVQPEKTEAKAPSSQGFVSGRA